MKMKSLFLVTLILICSIASSQNKSQQLISSAGDMYKNTSYQLDWSIGELQTEIYTVSGQTLTQGFHQNNYTISTAIELVKGMVFEISAYPNPTSDFISLKVENSKIGSLKYTITDLSGKVLQRDKLTKSNQQISFSSYSIGTYFITVSQNDKLLKTFKIIKN